MPKEDGPHDEQDLLQTCPMLLKVERVALSCLAVPLLGFDTGNRTKTLPDERARIEQCLQVKDPGVCGWNVGSHEGERPAPVTNAAASEPAHLGCNSGCACQGFSAARRK